MMFLLIRILFVIIAIFYVFLIKIYTIGWDRTEKYICNFKIPKTRVSVIIPVRNEEENIISCIKNFENQNYPTELLELIIVDDNSTDNTFEIALDYVKSKKNIFIIKNGDQKTSKKIAIEKGIQNSKGELIITTDADCFAGEKWIMTIVNFYERYNPKMIVSPVSFYNDDNIFKKFQTFEFFSLISSGAGAIKIKRPIMCNGANLAYPKKVFEDVNGFSDNLDYVSGDDVFLLQKIAKKYSANTIKFLKNYDAVVFTEPEKNLKDFINQRLRWTSKTKGNKSSWIIFNAIVVFLFNFCMVSGLIISLFFPKFWINVLLLFLIKLIIDYPILYNTAKFFKRKKLVWLYFPIQIIYSIYIVGIGFFGNFVNFKWKERKIKNKLY